MLRRLGISERVHWQKGRRNSVNGEWRLKENGGEEEVEEDADLD